jgi:hypothetical protein
MIPNDTKIILFFGNLFPTALAPSHRQDFTVEEEKKYERIREMIKEIGNKMGLSHPESVDFRITKAFGENACMVGNGISFSGPVMCLANDYFTHFEKPEILKDPEYREWKSCLEKMPDHPLKMGEWIDTLSPGERSRIHGLAKKFSSVLSSEELQGIMAHELGHAKHLHAWKKLFFMIPMAWGAVKVMDVVGHFWGSYTLFSIFFYLAMQQVQRGFEREADEASAVSKIYSAGVKSFFKRMTVVQLTKASPLSAAKRAETMLEGRDLFSSHPHPAKRVASALERKERLAQPISVLEKGIAFCGALLLTKEVAAIVSSVWNSVFSKRGKKA